MANGKFWTAQNEKLITSAGIGLTGYHVLAKGFAALPALPAFISKPIFGEISLLTVAGGLALYGVFMLYTKF